VFVGWGNRIKPLSCPSFLRKSLSVGWGNWINPLDVPVFEEVMSVGWGNWIKPLSVSQFFEEGVNPSCRRRKGKPDKTPLSLPVFFEKGEEGRREKRRKD
jgi:hypothetical protein